MSPMNVIPEVSDERAEQEDEDDPGESGSRSPSPPRNASSSPTRPTAAVGEEANSSKASSSGNDQPGSPSDNEGSPSEEEDSQAVEESAPKATVIPIKASKAKKRADTHSRALQKLEKEVLDQDIALDELADGDPVDQRRYLVKVAACSARAAPLTRRILETNRALIKLVEADHNLLVRQKEQMSSMEAKLDLLVRRQGGQPSLQNSPGKSRGKFKVCFPFATAKQLADVHADEVSTLFPI